MAFVGVGRGGLLLLFGAKGVYIPLLIYEYNVKTSQMLIGSMLSLGGCRLIVIPISHNGSLSSVTGRTGMSSGRYAQPCILSKGQTSK